MKEVLMTVLGLTFAALNVVSIMHGKEWQRTGSAWSWHLPLLLVIGGLAFVANSYLSRQEASHTFMAFVDGVLVIGTLALLYLLYREATSSVQWAGLAVVVAGLLLITFGKPAGGPDASGTETAEVVSEPEPRNEDMKR